MKENWENIVKSESEFWEIKKKLSKEWDSHKCGERKGQESTGNIENDSGNKTARNLWSASLELHSNYRRLKSPDYPLWKKIKK